MLPFGIKIILAASILLESSNSVESTGIGDIQTVVNFANDAWGVMNGDVPASALFLGSTTIMLDKIMAGVEEIAEKLDVIADTVAENGEKIDDMTDLLEHMLTRLPLQDKVDKSMRQLQVYMERVDFLFENLLLATSGKNFTRFTMLLYIDSVISEDSGDLVDVLTKMHHLFVPGRSATYESSLFYLLSERMQNTDDTECSKDIPSQTSIYEIYKSVEITEMRAFIITMTAYSLLSIYENASFSGELRLAKNDLIARSEKYVSVTQLTLERVPRSLYLCDIAPYHYEADENYVKFTKTYRWHKPIGHTMSLLPMESNYHENMVVTGVRFTEKYGVIFYQIKEAKLLPKGRVDATTERWIPLPDYELREVDDEWGYYHTGTDELVKSSDINIVYYRNRGFNVDEILLPPNRLITGIKFVIPKDDATLELMSCEFDYETGQLNPDTSMWGYSINAYSKEKRRELDVYNLKDPSNINKPQKIDLYRKGHFYFEVGADYMQANMIPMFDARPVGGNPSFPLAGLGLFHRGNSESGGIIQFEVFSIDMISLMKRNHDEK